MPTLATRLGCISRVYQTYDTASLYRFAREVPNQVAPGGIQNAFCHMPVPHHICDAQVFKRDTVVARDQPMRQFIQEVFAGVGDSLMQALQRRYCFTPVVAALLPA